MKFQKRTAPLEINKEDFKKIGHQLIDQLAEFFDSMNDRPVTYGEDPVTIQKIMGNHALPENGTEPESIISKTTDLLINHSLFNGHPKFMGYITSSPTPIGALGDMLAASINPNVGAQLLSPVATEIEKQTVRWLIEFIGLSPEYDGLLVSGGNMANFTAFLAARTSKAPNYIKEEGLPKTKKMISYCSKTTHTWIEKATILFGHGSNTIKWIATDSENKMDIQLLEKEIKKDLKNGHLPFIVVGTAGDVSTGTVDDLQEISTVCKKYDLWFHIDGAYGVPACAIPEYASLFDGLQEADSIALDPHKWLYAPLEAGCTLVKNPQHLIDTFSSHPEYYNFAKNEKDPSRNFYEFGLQNSRGFRALKVWLAFQQVGKNGYMNMIREDIQLSEYMYDLARNHSEIQAMTQNLSITTFRYVPSTIDQHNSSHLNTLNEALLDELQTGGEVFLSNAIIDNLYCLRACIVNFRTSKKDVDEIFEIIIRVGKKVQQRLQSKNN